jgi:PAS domain S-box-containing protein
MTIELIIAVFPYILSASTSFGVAAYCWRRRTVAGVNYYSIVATCWGLMTTGYVLELLAPTLSGKIAWDDFQFYPSFVIPIALLAFSTHYTERKPPYPHLIWGALWGIAITFSVIVLTNPTYHLMRDTAQMIPGQPFDALTYNFTTTFLIYTLYIYIVSMWAIVLLGLRWVQVSHPYRGQIGTILIGHIIPYVGTFLTVFGIIPTFERDTTPFWFAISNVIVWWGLYHYRLFDLTPIAREKLIEQLGDVVVVVDTNNRVVDLNRAAQLIVGNPRQNIIGKTLMEVFPQQIDLIQRFSEIDQISTELEIPGLMGTTYYDLKITPLYSEKKKLLGRLFVSHDITQLKRVQAELDAQRLKLKKIVSQRTATLKKTNRQLKQEIIEREQITRELSERDERLRMLTDATFEGIAISEKGVFVEANQQVADMFGVEIEDLIGKPITDFVAPESRDDVSRRIRAGTEAPYDHMAMKKDGTKFPVEVRSRMINYGGRLLRMTAVRDMTDEKEAEKTIRESEERFRLILDNMPILLDAFDAEGNIIVWNKACEEATGYSAAEMIGNPKAMDILYPDPEYRAKVWQASMDPENRETTFNLTSKNGELRTVMWFEIFRQLHVPGWAAWGLGLDITKQQNADTALRESERRYRAIVEDQAEFVVRWKPGGIRTFANEAYCRFFEQSYDEIIGTSFFPLIVPEAQQEVRDRIAKITRDTPVSTGIHEILRPDGTISWQEWTDRAIFDDQGQLIEMQSVGRDITDRIRVEEAEREQRTLAEALVDTATMLNSTLDLDSVLMHILDNLSRVQKHDAANIMLIENGIARVVRTRGYSPDADPVGAEYPLSKYKLINQLVSSRKPLVITDTLNERHWVASPESSSVRSIVGVPIYLKGQAIGIINLDSTKPDFFKETDASRLLAFSDQVAIAIRNAREFETERHERIMAQMFQQLAEGLQEAKTPSNILKVVIDTLSSLIPYHNAIIGLLEEAGIRIEAAQGSSLDADTIGKTYSFEENPRLLQILSHGQPVMLRPRDCPDDWDDLPGVNSESAVWVAISLTTWDVTTGLLCLTLNNPPVGQDDVLGTLMTFNQKARLVLENSRLLAELVSSKGDLQEAQSRLIRSAELAVAGEIATGVAHQISNPLTSVMVHAHLLLQKLPPDDPLYEYCKAIKNATDRAANVVQRMLDFARTREFLMQPFDVNSSLSTAASLVQPQIDPYAKLVLNLSPEPPMIIGSREHLEDVWINLLINARDALKGKSDGVITLTTSIDETQRSVIVTLEDNGPGIPPDTLGRVFSSFFTTKEDGVGLGLAICYDIITQHHGLIHVENKEGGGARFVMRLPLSDSQLNEG